MRAFVIGGNGFIGSHLVDALNQEGWHITVYDRAEEHYRSRLPGVNYNIGELSNRHLLESLLSQVDVLFHLVSTTVPQTSNETPIFDVQTNVVDTIALLEACVRQQVRKVVFVSSGGTVYGIPECIPVSEEHPTQPICAYGISKLAIEKYLYLFQRLYGLDYAILRPANPYGERQNPNGIQGFVGVSLGCIAKGEPVLVWGDGSVTRDYFHVSDLVHACLLAATTKTQSKIFNIGSGCGYSLVELIGIIQKIVHQPFHVIHTPPRPFDVPELVLNIERAQFELGWYPQVSLEVGLERTWKWIQTVL